MNTIAINSANPILEFYSKLLYLMKKEELFDYDLAEELVNLSESKHVSIEISVDSLKDSHEKLMLDDDESYLGDEMAESCFADLAPQMRNRAARDLFESWNEFTLNFDNMFIHVRKAKEFGDGFAAVTIVTNNIKKFKSQMYQNKYSSYITED